MSAEIVYAVLSLGFVALGFALSWWVGTLQDGIDKHRIDRDDT